MPPRSYLRVGSAAVLALALAVPAGGALAQEGTTITMLTPSWGVPPDADALAAFEAESGIAVEVIDAGQMETLFTNVSVAAAAGEPAADVIFLTEEAPSNIVATGNVEDISDLVEAAGTDLGQFDQAIALYEQGYEKAESVADSYLCSLITSVQAGEVWNTAKVDSGQIG